MQRSTGYVLVDAREQEMTRRVASGETVASTRPSAGGISMCRVLVGS